MLEYVCDLNPRHISYSEKPLKRCPHCVLGKACEGTLWRIGSGAIAANKEYAASRGVKIPDGLPGGKRDKQEVT